MTYLVNEKCIKCKYTDCVEVCPVDCFYEGENMLENKGFFLNVHVSRLDDLQGLSLLSDKQALFETLLQEMTYDSD